MAVSGPTVVRRQLGRRLQRLREAAGVTAVQVEQAHIASRTKVWRIEAGRVPVRVADVWALCKLYSVSTEETESLAALATGTSEHGWWQEYAEAMPEWFKLYVGLEGAASQILTWEDSVVPGELQTAGYARALWQGGRPNRAAEDIEPHIAIRMERQRALFERTPPPQLVIVLGENVLRREVGGPTVLAAQIEHLRQLDQRDHVDIRVLPFKVGAHPATTGAFRILDFADEEDPDVVYLEAEVGARYLEKPAELEEYRRIWDLLHQMARPIGEFAP
jgi:transcriptional regulator with XRE-family HTH domain